MAVMYGVFANVLKKCRLIHILIGAVVLLSACSESGSTSSDNSSQSLSGQTVATDVLADPISSIPTAVASSTESTESTDATDAPLADSVSSASEQAQLTTRLENGFVLENEQLVPTNGWICEDVFEQLRIYYFYPAVVLDRNRRVVVERTLIGDDRFNDINFFWSPSGPDSILMTSTSLGDDGTLLSTGQQFDVNTIAFAEVNSVDSFTAESVLRGRLVCANFDLR